MRTRLTNSGVPRRIPNPKVPEPTGKTHDQLIALAQELEEATYALFMGGYGRNVVVRTLRAQPQFISIDRDAIREAAIRVEQELNTVYEEEARRERPLQVARLKNDLANMRGMTKPPYQHINRHEETLGRILGTFAPQRLEVDVFTNMRQSLATVIVDLTPEDADQMVAEQLALEAHVARSKQAAE